MLEANPLHSYVATADELGDDGLERCVGLLNAAFGSWPGGELEVSPEEHLRWKLEAPGPVPARAHLVEADAQLAALGVYIPRVYRVFGKNYRVMDAVDAAVHPKFQGRGIYSYRRDAKAELVDHEYDFTLSYSTNPRVVSYRLRRGRDDVPGRPRVLVRVNDVWRTASRAARGRWWLVPGLAPVLLGLRLCSRPLPRRGSSPERTWELTAAERFDDRVDDLNSAVANVFDFIQVRNAEVLNWRYADLRGGRHHIVLARRAGELLGYVVYRRSGSRGLIMDLLVLPGRSDVATSLLDEATTALADCETVTCWATPGHPYERLIRGRSYFDFRQDSGMAFRPISVSEELFSPLRHPNGRAHAVLGDTDWL